jgi:deoxyribodipyrimidine photo-lyase
MDSTFEKAYSSILKKLDQVDPVKYGRTRNYLNGAVTYLSPYISRGVISTKQVLEHVLAKGYKIAQIENFVKELCWRDYFQRVAQVKDLNSDIKQLQTPITNHGISSSIINASTGIDAIDHSIKQLYQTGYMHNHCRMYLSSIACNIARSHWHHPAQWMYYHLLDGDWASNACSWQWVAGANSSKKYYANQENINKYCYTDQVNTYLDTSYELLENMDVPASLSVTEKTEFQLELPECSPIEIDATGSTYIYNYYNLDPRWHKDEEGNRVLLIEPDFFAAYPVSKKCIDFMLALSKNIPGIKIYVGSFKSFKELYKVEHIYYKEHPLNIGYDGIEEPRDWISDKVIGYHPSFFSYWKKIERFIYKQY